MTGMIEIMKKRELENDYRNLTRKYFKQCEEDGYKCTYNETELVNRLMKFDMDEELKGSTIDLNA